MKTARVLLVLAVLFEPLSELHADGGAVRFSERRGNYRITVFTSPTPLRAGPVDVSVFIQDAATGEPVPGDLLITVQASPRGQSDDLICHLATTEAATNKLFHSAMFVLSEAGWWDVTVSIDGQADPIEVQFAMEAGKPLPRIWEITPWITWPAVVVLLFVIQQWRVQRERYGRERIKKAGPHG